MKKSELLKLLIGIARPLGYERRGSLFWKSGDELTTLVHLQSSRWGGAVYCNIGVIPSSMITRSVPPGPEYWPIGERCETLPSPFQRCFERLAVDDNDEMTSEEMEGGLRWMLAWLEDNFGDAGRVRRSVLGLEPPSPAIASRLSQDAEEWIMTDWARGDLKEPSHYFKGLPYYR